MRRSVDVYCSPRYELTLPGHVWPTVKYRLIAERLQQQPDRFTLLDAPMAEWDDLALAHHPEYLERLRHNRLTPAEVRTLELPWRAEFADVFRTMAGGTIAAARAALDRGASAHLGGGLHHAFAGHGEGFCPLNDIAIAIRVLQREGRVTRGAVVDLDVHHGNGTAMIFERDPSVFTFSMHQQHNYPAFKPRGDLDIGLEDGAGDGRYLAALAEALPQVVAGSPELIVYVAGADPFLDDRLGGLSLTKAGLAERDRLVVRACRAAGIPLVVTLAGGYATDLADTIDIQEMTVETLAAIQ